ncbi:FCD domain-containing protein [uncultured Brevundimonas sp.]|uniref:GntR family transcriptional regulator n=1 Tax=uncultured Brevundimonas sp. TaxID=213418 RepID=UPI00262B8EA7|nr:FCD domain-containing protein [uncultured Brevundimonas sp.]
MNVVQTVELTDTERAFNALRRAILHGDHAPGEKLKMEELKARYGLGASPLREALARLTSERLVAFNGGRGFRVTGVSVEDLQEIAAVRKLLEGAALRESIARGGDEWEAGIVAAFHRLGVAEKRVLEDSSAMDECEARNREFHQNLMAAAGSERLIQLAEDMYDQHERYRRLSRLERSPSRNVHEEHKAIMNAALERNADLAARLNDEHIDKTTQRVSQMIAEMAHPE